MTQSPLLSHFSRDKARAAPRSSSNFRRSVVINLSRQSRSSSATVPVNSCSGVSSFDLSHLANLFHSVSESGFALLSSLPGNRAVISITACVVSEIITCSRCFAG